MKDSNFFVREVRQWRGVRARALYSLELQNCCEGWKKAMETGIGVTHKLGLQHASSNLQQTYITTAIKLARKWAAPRP